MIKKTTIALSVGLIFSAIPAAHAVSQDECSIWLCLPGGFPSGCGNAKSAMKDRIKDFKPPLPNFAECVINDNSGSNMTYTYQYAAYVPEHQECKRWSYRYMGHGETERVCVQWQTIPTHYVKNQRCVINRSHGEEISRSPAYCTATKRYIDVYSNGQSMGDTYYW